MKLTIAILAVLVAAAAAHCPNQCSGHGNCGAFDQCSCWPNWQGNDCSLRTCAYGNAWAVDHAHDAHYYSECSNKGLCDRATGLCECFDGYTGRACTRSVCANDCSGHGKCRLVRDLNAVSTNDANAYTGWDANMIQTCICDGGFQGADCSERKCQTGDDVLTSCAPDPTNMIQHIELFYGDDVDDVDRMNDELALVFTDNLGNVFKTRRIEQVMTDGGPADMKAALEGLPNFAVPSVTVNREAVETGVATNYSRVGFYVTFTDSRNSGNVSLLSCESTLGCMNAGCQPKYRQPHQLQMTLDEGATYGGVLLHNETVLTDSAITTQEGGVLDGVIEVRVFGNNSNALGQRVINQYQTRITLNGQDIDNTNDFTDHGNIPNDFTHVDVSNGVVIAFESRVAQQGYYRFNYRVPTCKVSVKQYASKFAENTECGGRGVCDRASGTCDCFEGWYGNSCGMQSILV